MKKRELLRRIEELERRLAEASAPMFIPQFQIVDSNPNPPCDYCLGKPYWSIYPMCTCGRVQRHTITCSGTGDADWLKVAQVMYGTCGNG